MVTPIAHELDLESEIYGSQLLTGTPISPGIVAGHARVLTTPDAGYVEPGAVLVIGALTAEWLGLLNSAGAVVAETASLLSEPATVARELGVPVVAGVALAAEMIRDGQMVVVDGGHGTVLVEP
ncbi:MAG TPA: PEP-utilizing enzyme [Chloroflexota bacterium]|nr:PEP-utilizing enzyme [Chloroflexota bacterium]